jgi:predicted phosphatase
LCKHVLAMCCHIRNETYLWKRISLTLISSQILQIKTKEISVNAGQKINKRWHSRRTFKHRAKQAVSTIFNLYNKDRNKKKKALAVIYNLKTSDDKDSHFDEIYKSLVKKLKKHK